MAGGSRDGSRGVCSLRVEAGGGGEGESNGKAIRCESRRGVSNCVGMCVHVYTRSTCT